MKKFEEKIQNLINLYKLKKFNEAEKITNTLIKEKPENVWFYNFLGLIKIEQEKFDESILYFEKGIKIDSTFPMLYDNLGTAYKIKKDYFKSEYYYKKSIEINNINPEAHNNLGNLYRILNDNVKAIKSYQNSIKAKTNFYPAHYNLAITYKSIGDFVLAKMHFKKTIELNNNFFAAHRSLSEIINYSQKNSHFKMLNEIYEKNNELNKKELAFALGKAYEDIKDYKKSFKYYSEGNKLHRKTISFSLSKEAKEFNLLKKIFNKNLLKKYKDSGIKDKTPIFILGMPRSGTTLVEQILSSHPKVFPGDELNFFPDTLLKVLSPQEKEFSLEKSLNFNKIELENIGKKYIKNLHSLSKSQKITDKLPINFKWIGFIKLALPKAKIIHCVRNSKDTCLSIYKNYFVNKKLNYAYDLTELSEFYNLYLDLMNYWKISFPNYIYDIKYENIINNPKHEISNLLKTCNLNWNPNCLNFHKNKRVIKTASDTQVRKKIYKSSLNSWKNFEKYSYKFFDNLKD